MDAHQARNLAPAVLFFTAMHALVMRFAQRFNQIALELSHELSLDAVVVDGFV